jgi:hypothetical protein
MHIIDFISFQINPILLHILDFICQEFEGGRKTPIFGKVIHGLPSMEKLICIDVEIFINKNGVVVYHEWNKKYYHVPYLR